MNNDFELDKSIDLESLQRQAAMNKSRYEESDETKVVGADWMTKSHREKMNNVEPPMMTSNHTTPSAIEYENKPELIPDEDAPNAMAEGIIDTPNEEYTGPGLVINADEYKEEAEEEIPRYTGVTPKTEEYLKKYLQEMDADIAEAKQIAEARKLEEENEEDELSDEDNEMTSDEFNEKYNEAVVIIDKTNFGRVINFSKEEHDKLEKANKIKLEEIENISLETIKTKKIKKKADFNKIIKKVTNITTTNVVLPISGYVAEMGGCSAYELISLLGTTNDNPMLSAQNRWSIIHDKVVSSSIGKMDFNDFLLNTAASDYETLIYGILCSTYPEDGTITITCDKCKKKYEHPYSVKSLIRAELMEDKLKDTFVEIVDNSLVETDAKHIHENSIMKQVKRIKLPVSGVIAEIYVQSAYDLLNKSVKSLNENKDSKYNDTAVISTLVNTLYIPDMDEPGSYFEIDDALEISKAIYSMNEKDIMIIRSIGEELMKDMSVEFGLMNITCPYCKKYTASMPVDVENILFFRYQKALNTTIE